MVKRKRYYYENLTVTGVDKTTMYHLDSLYTKYTRDYLPWFKGIADMYKKGAEKKAAEDSVQLVEKARSLLDSVLKTGTVTKEDSERLFNYVDEIEARKESFSEKMSLNKSLAKKADEVAKKTGVAIEDLNITRDVAKRSVEQAQRVMKASREGALQFLQRTAPRAYQLGSESLQAALGPFGQMGGLGLGLAREVFNVGSGIKDKLQERKDRKLQSLLRPVASQVSLDDLDRLHMARESGPTLGDVASGVVTKAPSSRDEFAPLMNFFDKGAYKAKWTKELLDLTKKNAERSKAINAGGITDLLGKFKDLGAGILPLIGKAGLLAGLAAATVATSMALKAATEQYTSAKKSQAEAADRLSKATNDKIEQIKKMGLQEYSTAVGKSQKQVLLDIDANQQRSQRERYNALPWWSKEKFIGRLGSAYTGENPWAPKVEAFDQRLLRLESELGSSKGSQGSTATPPQVPQVNVTVPGMEEFGKTLKETVEQMKQASQVQQPGPRLVNPYDSGDTLIREHAKGSLTLGD